VVVYLGCEMLENHERESLKNNQNESNKIDSEKKAMNGYVT